MSPSPLPLQPQPPPLNAPPFRIEHPAAPGVVFAVGATTEHCRSLLNLFNATTPGFVTVANVAGASAVAMPADAAHAGPECPFAVDDFVIDQFTEKIGRVTFAGRHSIHIDFGRGGHVHKVPETAFLYFHKSDRESFEVQLAEEKDAPPVPPALPAPAAETPAPDAIDCPFKLGHVVQDKHSGNGGPVVEITAAGMRVDIPGLAVPHFVPAANYEDWHESTLKEITAAVKKAAAAAESAKTAAKKKEADARAALERSQRETAATARTAAAKSKKNRRAANASKHGRPNRAALVKKKNSPADPAS